MKAFEILIVLFIVAFFAYWIYGVTLVMNNADMIQMLFLAGSSAV